MTSEKLEQRFEELCNTGSTSAETESEAKQIAQLANGRFAQEPGNVIEASITGRPGLWQVVIRGKQRLEGS